MSQGTKLVTALILCDASVTGALLLTGVAWKEILQAHLVFMAIGAATWFLTEITS